MPQDIKKLFASAVNKVSREQGLIDSNNIRIGTIVAVYDNNTADVKITSETSVLPRLQLPLGSSGVSAGNKCVIISPDSKNLNISYIASVYDSSMPSLNVNALSSIGQTESDALSALSIAWTAFTPAWTNLTVGDGTNGGRYAKIGKTVVYEVLFIHGTTSSVGSAPYFTLPVAKSASFNANLPIGSVRFWDNNVTTWYNGMQSADGYVFCFNASGTYLQNIYVTAGAPFTFAVNDYIAITGFYESA